jgi:hypothetical protein
MTQGRIIESTCGFGEGCDRLADRRKPTDRDRNRQGDQNAAGRNSGVTSLSLPNIAGRIADDKALTEDAFFPMPHQMC